jgi:hypothetical protein
VEAEKQEPTPTLRVETPTPARNGAGCVDRPHIRIDRPAENIDGLDRVFRLGLGAFDEGLIVSTPRTISSNLSGYSVVGFDGGPRSGLCFADS